MIRINLTPCLTCVYYQGVMQKDHIEVGEYLRCRKSEDNNSNSLLYVHENKIKCDYFKDDEADK